MEINVNIQAADIAAALDKLASAIVNLTGDSIETTEPESPKKRTRKTSKAASNQDGQTSTDEAVNDHLGLQPATPIQMQQPGYCPQTNAAPQPTVPLYQHQQPAAPPVFTAPVQAPSLQTAVPTYTIDQLGFAGMQLVDAGRRDEVVQLLAQFGVDKLTDLPKERYAEYAMALRQRGAKI